jgi:hypothetical protein
LHVMFVTFINYITQGLQVACIVTGCTLGVVITTRASWLALAQQKNDKGDVK